MDRRANRIKRLHVPLDAALSQWGWLHLGRARGTGWRSQRSNGLCGSRNISLVLTLIMITVGAISVTAFPFTFGQGSPRFGRFGAICWCRSDRLSSITLKDGLFSTRFFRGNYIQGGGFHVIRFRRN